MAIHDIFSTSYHTKPLIHPHLQVVFPQQGFIFIPSHLRVLHVTQEAIVLTTSAWRNLTFGQRGLEPQRVRRNGWRHRKDPLKGGVGIGDFWGNLGENRCFFEFLGGFWSSRSFKIPFIIVFIITFRINCQKVQYAGYAMASFSFSLI